MKKEYKNPSLAVDIIIEVDGAIVLIYRKNEPHGWALPGGFQDIGESCVTAAIREALEETSLHIYETEQFHTYSNPKRDPRQHVVSVVYIAKANGRPVAADDAKRACLVDPRHMGSLITSGLCFDHQQIVADYIAFKRTGERPTNE